MSMRGYFAVGVETMSKARNLGNLMRSAHAFGASYIFTIGAQFSRKEFEQADTSRSYAHTPYFRFKDRDDFFMPPNASLVVVELTDEAVPLPSFRHPQRAIYLLGPERESVSPAMLERADHVVKIPMKFCVNVATAGAILHYDRLLQQGRHPDRPVAPGGPLLPMPEHVHGGHFSRIKAREQRGS